MSESLRDQLLKAGFVAKPQNKPQPQKRPQQAQRPQQRSQQQQQRPPQSQQRPRRDGEIDLAKAYALRDRNEREERARAQREAEQRAREKKERKQKLADLLNGKALNAADADIPRHFPHANKIRRIYVTAEQLPRLNGGELAVAQFSGRYLLVTRETGLAAQAVDADALVLLCDSQTTDDDGVPADLVW